MLSCHPDHRPSAAMVRSHHFRFGWDVAHCQDRLDEDGYVVVKGIFPEPMISAAVAAIRDRVLLLLRLYDLMPANADGVFEALLSAIPLLHRAPPGWPGLPFGALGKRGWVKPVGSGRMFDAFTDPKIMSIQESCRPLVAAASGRDASSLKLVPERCSVKVGSCSALGPHLDPHRQGGLQVDMGHRIPSVAKVA
jgi:hypothetical protein